MQSPTNKVLVSIAHRYIGNITDLINRSSIQNNASVHLEDMATIVGKVEALPKVVTEDRLGLNGFSTADIRVGDYAIFSHTVVLTLENTSVPGEEPIYKNQLLFQGKEYWMADISLIYGVIRDGEIIMVNGFVMAKPFQEAKIHLAASSKRAKGTVKCQVMHIGNSRTHQQKIEAKQGDWVFFNPMIATKYQINNKPFVIIQQSHVLGVEVPQ
jgi:co-chaperonin GroES (HSP10)